MIQATLTRLHKLSTGIFGTLNIGQANFFTAEHSYQTQENTFEPKVPCGTYICKRGIHQLEGRKPTELFQIMDVPGHTNVLLHAGNFPQVDSDGCVLLGSALELSLTPPMITSSRSALASFLILLDGVEEFQLTVI